MLAAFEVPTERERIWRAIPEPASEQASLSSANDSAPSPTCDSPTADVLASDEFDHAIAAKRRFPATSDARYIRQSVELPEQSFWEGMQDPVQTYRHSSSLQSRGRN